jgi:hypothetical protein
VSRRRRWRLVIAVVVLAGIGVFAAMQERSNNKREGGPPFTDLNTALAPMRAHGWKVLVPPKDPGPYRMLPQEPGAGGGSGLQAHIKDKSGQVIEEIKLDPSPDTEQTIVYLETPSGRVTMAGLKRPK